MAEPIAIMDPLGDGISSLALLDFMGAGPNDIVDAARGSYGAEAAEYSYEQNVKLLRSLWTRGHTSPFEHAVLKFHVVAPLFVIRQWHRHRTQSYNEISRRYTSKNIQIYYPSEWRGQAEKNHQASEGVLDRPSQIMARTIYQSSVEQSVQTYEALLHLGVAREQARMVLPGSLYTTMVVTANLLNWLKFVSLRDHDGAQPEIRAYGKGILGMIGNIFPETAEAFDEGRH